VLPSGRVSGSAARPHVSEMPRVRWHPAEAGTRPGYVVACSSSYVRVVFYKVQNVPNGARGIGGCFA
jgi:hypothetical protein